jgi:hypothetical protein
VGRTLRNRRHLPANLGQTRPSPLIPPSSDEPARQRVCTADRTAVSDLRLRDSTPPA